MEGGRNRETLPFRPGPVSVRPRGCPTAPAPASSCFQLLSGEIQRTGHKLVAHGLHLAGKHLLFDPRGFLKNVNQLPNMKGVLFPGSCDNWNLKSTGSSFPESSKCCTERLSSSLSLSPPGLMPGLLFFPLYWSSGSCGHLHLTRDLEEVTQGIGAGGNVAIEGRKTRRRKIDQKKKKRCRLLG